MKQGIPRVIITYEFIDDSGNSLSKKYKVLLNGAPSAVAHALPIYAAGKMKMFFEACVYMGLLGEEKVK